MFLALCIFFRGGKTFFRGRFALPDYGPVYATADRKKQVEHQLRLAFLLVKEKLCTRSKFGYSM